MIDFAGYQPVQMAEKNLSGRLLYWGKSAGPTPQAGCGLISFGLKRHPPPDFFGSDDIYILGKPVYK